MSGKRSIYLPSQFALHSGLFGNPIRQLARPAETHSGLTPTAFSKRAIKGEAVELSDGRKIIAVPRKVTADSRFEGEAPDIPVQNVFPKMSTVVYRTHCKNWQPDEYHKAFKESQLQREPAINRRDRVLVVVTREIERVPWGDVRDIQNMKWQLYLVHWDADQQLLFINSSNNNTMHEELAEELCGENISIVRGENVFRCLYGLRRILLTNLGLNHSLSRAVRFTWYVGRDIVEGLMDRRQHEEGVADTEEIQRLNPV